MAYFLTCPPKTGPGVMLVTWAGERGAGQIDSIRERHYDDPQQEW